MYLFNYYICKILWWRFLSILVDSVTFIFPINWPLFDQFDRFSKRVMDECSEWTLTCRHWHNLTLRLFQGETKILKLKNLRPQDYSDYTCVASVRSVCAIDDKSAHFSLSNRTGKHTCHHHGNWGTSFREVRCYLHPLLSDGAGSPSY